jgi:hypothetical protein
MADFVFNIAKGEVKKYAKLDGGANDALIVVPIENTGIEADATLKDYDDLAALLAGASNEQATIGRKTVTSASITVDDTNDRVDIDIADQVWTTPSGNQIGALIICYDPDTTAGTDSTLVPLTKHDWVITPEGDSITATITNFDRAS